MAGTISGSSLAGPGGQGRRRPRQPVPRTRTVEFTLTGEEYAALVEAARQAGMARRAYVATVVLDGAANGTTISSQDPLELILIELMRAAGAGPPHHHQLEPGGRHADRNRAACRRPAALRSREHTPRRPHRRRRRRGTQSPAATVTGTATVTG
jgi:hypothetical protein